MSLARSPDNTCTSLLALFLRLLVTWSEYQLWYPQESIGCKMYVLVFCGQPQASLTVVFQSAYTCLAFSTSILTADWLNLSILLHVTPFCQSAAQIVCLGYIWQDTTTTSERSRLNQVVPLPNHKDTLGLGFTCYWISAEDQIGFLSKHFHFI